MAAVAALLCVCFSAHTACPVGAGPQCSATLATGPSVPRRIVFSPAAVAADGTGLHAYTVSTGAAVTVPAYAHSWDIDFSPDGATVVLAAFTDGVAVVSLTTGTELWSNSTKGKCFSVAYSPDGTRVVSGHEDGGIYIWDAVTGALVFSFSGPQSQVRGLRYTIDGTKIINGCSAGKVIVWDAMNGNSLKVLTDHSSNMRLRRGEQARL
eukprot:TRINITY_DN3766_c0_g1_i1.p1 TRINITY_DN3766_c0_g1~~TRINITY_DN3766_c0_g1_i1.p1  ORF type:complete len:209 (+),score=0.40 TRINITY_DN3766_c0_g1_i1:52-678(+)